MCGIAGIVGAGDQHAASEDVNRMLGVLKRRGPDDAGVEGWDAAVLGHRRLSIFDLSAAGHQPMLSADRKLGIVFNGAIYNFRELRSQLERSGHSFRSRSDTEVLIYGYREWGIDGLLRRIDGMFAFGLWDQDLEKLFLVRDRLGVKPLAFCLRDGELAFASTVRALKNACGGALNEAAVVEFLEFGFVTDEHSIYRGIEKVAAGELVEWQAGNVSRRKYWDLPETTRADSISFAEAVEETERLFLAAVEKRLHADVPIGALLSGGIDSSLVCWAVSKLGGDVTAFTVGTPADAEDETAAAADTAKALKIRHRVLELSSDADPNVSEMVEAFAEPFACASALGMLRISKEVRKSATVLLTGDGGDDVFLGYPEHKHFQLSGKLARNLPEAATGIWLKARQVMPETGTAKRAVSFVDYAVGGLAAVGNARDGLPFYQKSSVLGERLRHASLPHRSMKWSVASGRNLLAEFLNYDRQTRFVGEYLPKVDGATMHYALEARSPFLDTKLWEFAAALPFSLRLNNGMSKAILREIARRRIGESVARGKKKGFIIPVQRWIAGRWKPAVTEALRESMLQKDGWIDAEKVLSVLQDAAKRRWAPRQLWFLFVLESWLRYERDDAAA